MIGSIKRLFGGRPPEPKEEIDPVTAAAALFAEAGLVDGVYAEIESGRVRDILREAFDLTEAEADQALTDGEAAAEGAIDAHSFTKRVKTLPLSQREKVIEGLYLIALADGERCAFEDAFIRHVASLLHVDDIRRAKSRQRAEARHRGD